MPFKTFLLLTFLLCVSPLICQDCGVNYNDQVSWLPKYLEHLSSSDLSFSRNNESEIPIVLHLVAKDNGVGRARMETSLGMLCELNELYAAVGFSFYLTRDGINFINHDGIFTNNDFAVNKLAMQNEKRDSALNVFIVNTLGSNNVVGFYDSDNDWVILRKSVFVEGNKTLAHEIGHLFSLLHPHFGWDGMGWDEMIHGNPSPEIASNGITLTEKMDGSNCSSAGDLLCDTPPDYNFGIAWQQSCAYSGGARDPDNVIVDPDEKLIMSYFNETCRQVFSDQQIQIMQLDLAHPSRDYLHPYDIPQLDSLESLVIPIAPIGQMDIANNNLEFEWEAVNNAQYYYIEYDRSPDYDLDPQGVITTQNRISINHPWQSGLNYYWRVFAWNELDFCSPPSITNQFNLEIVSTVNDLNDNITINIFPSANELILKYHMQGSQEFDVNIFDLRGKEIFSNKINLRSGNGIYSINLPIHPKGIFVLSMVGKTNFNQLIYFP